MKFKEVLGTISPVYGMMSGQGAFGKLADSGLGGVIPAVLAQQRRKKRDGTEMTAAEEAAASQAPAMRKGGKVKMKSASARADGCAIRGKTRGKIV